MAPVIELGPSFGRRGTGMADHEAILEIRELRKWFGGVHALDGVDMEVYDGEILGIIGPNGSGKTTLFNVIAGVHRPTGGSVKWLGQDITGKSAESMAGRGIIRTFQQAMAFEDLTVRDNVGIACQHRPRDTRADQTYEGLSNADEIIEFVGLSEFADEKATNLGFGNLRRLGVGIAIGGHPRLLMADEPAAGLNDHETADLSELIESVRKRGVTVAVIDHDMNMMMNICDRLVVLDFGQKIAEGPPDEVRNDPTVLEVYLGEDLAAAAD
jgi:ABC-type branched-subunit amino acid transport system ATPase component